MEGLLASTLWHIVIDVLAPQQGETVRVNSNQKHSNPNRNPLFVPNAPESSNRAHLFLFEDDAAVIITIIKPTHASCF